jgi:hypothetical protein
MIQLILKFLGQVLTIFKTNNENMKKKVTTDTNTKQQINANTQIVFTLKSFIGTIVTILGIFYGFYQLVIVSNEKQYNLMFEDQKSQNQIFYDKLGNINSSLGSLSATIEAMNKENQNHEKPIANTGGSLENNAKIKQ